MLRVAEMRRCTIIDKAMPYVSVVNGENENHHKCHGGMASYEIWRYEISAHGAKYAIMSRNEPNMKISKKLSLFSDVFSAENHHRVARNASAWSSAYSMAEIMHLFIKWRAAAYEAHGFVIVSAESVQCRERGGDGGRATRGVLIMFSRKAEQKLERRRKLLA